MSQVFEWVGYAQTLTPLYDKGPQLFTDPAEQQDPLHVFYIHGGAKNQTERGKAGETRKVHLLDDSELQFGVTLEYGSASLSMTAVDLTFALAEKTQSGASREDMAGKQWSVKTRPNSTEQQNPSTTSSCTALRHALSALNRLAGLRQLGSGVSGKGVEKDELQRKCGRHVKPLRGQSILTLRYVAGAKLGAAATSKGSEVARGLSVTNEVTPWRMGQHTLAVTDEKAEYGLKERDEGVVHGEEDQKTLDAYAELRRMKQEGLIRHIGLTGFPVLTLIRLSLLVLHTAPHQPVDIVMSYSQLTLQNSRFSSLCSVHLKHWSREKVLSFIPPDGRFTLLDYHYSNIPRGATTPAVIAAAKDHVPIPFLIKTSIDLDNTGGEEFLRSNLPRTCPHMFENVIVELGLGKGASGIKCVVLRGSGGFGSAVGLGTGDSGASWAFDARRMVLKWRIPSMWPSTTWSIQGSFVTSALHAMSHPHTNNLTILRIV
ncbi:hypothetical protein PQX77_006128 [Marasmius sp. AFHP31]|nr:hypothetical protein PQX77_006128 [Marasmius sp. AFHP31]